MTRFLPIRGTTTQINNTPVVDGQILFETNNSNGQNHIYVDVDNDRIPVGISDWSQVVNKPFETIGSNLAVVNNVLSATSQSWNQITNKPFNTIGSGLTVVDGALTANVPTPTWNNVNDKPFSSIGSGLTVDSNNRLNADVRSVSVSMDGTIGTNNTYRYEKVTINMNGTITNTEIKGTKCMQYTQTLDTVGYTVYNFVSSEITTDSAIDVYSSMWDVSPVSVEIHSGVCNVWFAPYETANTDLTCRIYIK